VNVKTKNIQKKLVDPNDEPNWMSNGFKMHTSILATLLSKEVLVALQLKIQKKC